MLGNFVAFLGRKVVPNAYFEYQSAMSCYLDIETVILCCRIVGFIMNTWASFQVPLNCLLITFYDS